MGKRIIDLSVTLGGRGFVGPSFFPPVLFEAIHTHEEHGKSNTKLNYPIHVGTHADAPYHALPDAQPIDEIPLEKFIGQAILVDVREHIKPLRGLTLDQLKRSFPDGLTIQGKIFVIHSGWLKKMYGSQDYYDQYPYLTSDVTRWLVDQDIKALALDCAIDAKAATTVEGGFVNHRLLASAGIPIIENVTNLEELPSEFEFIGFPAKLFRCDGAPVRAVAIVDSKTD